MVEVPRGSFLKRGSTGHVDFISPLPCPFNYGSVPSHIGQEGDLLDALVLGPRLPLGARVRVKAWGAVTLTDRGMSDDKLVCGERAPPHSGATCCGSSAFMRSAKACSTRGAPARGETPAKAGVRRAPRSLARAPATMRGAGHRLSFEGSTADPFAHILSSISAGVGMPMALSASARRTRFGLPSQGETINPLRANIPNRSLSRRYAPQILGKTGCASVGKCDRSREGMIATR